jgi:hypothetical protein
MTDPKLDLMQPFIAEKDKESVDLIRKSHITADQRDKFMLLLNEARGEDGVSIFKSTIL